MAGLQELLQGFIDAQQLSPLDKRRADAALSSLVGVLGNVDQRCLVLDTQTELGSIVSVPGDKAPWIVFGVYGDDTYDIVREGSAKSQERMYGWRRGQSRIDYDRELASDPDLVDE